MTKRILATILVLIVLLGVSASVATAAAPAYYQVGFAKVDINPYVDENDHSKGLMALPMAGNGFSNQRLSEPTKIDDNGDGRIDDRDGIFATCVAITDPSGNTMLILSADFCGSHSGLVTDLRLAIHEKYPEIDPTRVMYTASHTHSSVDLSVSGLSEKAAADLALYNQRLRVNLLRMVDEALADRSAATMHKGQIEANDSKAAKGDIGDTINKYRPADDQVTVLPGENYPNRVYNSVRHRAISIYPAVRNVYKKQSGSKIPYYTYPKDANKNYIPDLTKEPITYIKGSNFNPAATLGGSSSIVYYADENGNKIADTKEEAAAWSEKTGKTAYWLADVGVVADIQRVSEADDTLLAWEFRFQDTSRKPIVLINWRTHTTMNRYVSDDKEELKAQGKYQDLGFYTSYYQISGDWVNAMRFVLEENGYRTAFIQGAAGNITGGDGTWDSYETETDRTHYRNNGNIFGTELAEVALECLREHMVQINVNGGDIRNKQIVYQTEKQDIDPGMFIAAHIYKAAYKPAAPLGTKPYDVVYWQDANGAPLIDKATGKSMVDDTTGQALQQTDADGNVITDSDGNPLYYTDKDGNPVVGVTRIAEVTKIASIHHANSVISKYKSASLNPGRLELNAFVIGKEFAMVTAPNELFDRFSEDATMETINQYNDWEKLWNMDTYGEPFMMGYANDSKGYISYQVAWDYSKGVLNWSGKDVYAQGSYETQVGWFKRGTGEELMDVYKWMLDTVDATNTADTLSGYCQHCQKETQWYPISSGLENTVVLTSGHYYMDTDTTPGISIRSVNNVCVDMRGRQVESELGRIFYVNKQATLNIQDSVGGGSLIGTGYDLDDKQNGGVVFVDTDGVLNLYSGRLTNRLAEDRSIYNGGAVCVYGTFNMYGGSIENCVSHWAGGNVYIAGGGVMNMRGGQIIGGTAKVANTGCVLARGALILANDAKITKVRLWPDSSQPAMEDILTIDGVFTGDVCLQIESAADDMDIGNLINGGSYAPHNLYFASNSSVPYITDTNIVLGRPKAAAIYGENGFEGYTNTVKAAITACQGTGKIIALQRKNSEKNTVSKDVTIDLNGFRNVNMLTVKDGATVYLKDSKTDDFTGGFGYLEELTGTVKAAEGYLLYTDEKGYVSSHAYDLTLTAAVLRPGAAGMYFTGDFKGDAQAKSMVESWGVAMDAYTAPTADSMNTTTRYTVCSPETETSASVLLSGILKESNNSRTNRRNGEMTVYAAPYARLTDGTILFGEVKTRSFRELTELADARYSQDTLPEELRELYSKFSPAMDTWNIPNLKK